MRCTRCNRPAVPQAVAITPAGLLVFGWCLTCLEAAGCQQIKVAHPPRRPSTRLRISQSGSWSMSAYLPGKAASTPPHPLDQRRKLAAIVALMLMGWGLTVFVVELGLWLRSLRNPPQLLAYGTPALLIGGGATTAVGLALLALNSSRPLLQSKWAFRVIQGLGFLSMLIALLAGIVLRGPRRSPIWMGMFAAALIVSVLARRIEVRRSRAIAP